MAILEFQKPDKVALNQADDFHGQFEFRPLEPGYGITVGNALRRVLLSSLEGFAITSFRIDGIGHEFTTINGVVEDVTEIVLNLKQVRFKRQITGEDNETVRFKFSGKEQFTAGDIGAHTGTFQVLNTDFVICNLDPNVELNIEFTIGKGRGYRPSEENQRANASEGTIFIDSIFTPIKNVKFKMENYRVEQKTDYEKLVIDVTTDGSISPKDSLQEAAKILIHHFMLFSEETIKLETSIPEEKAPLNEEDMQLRKLLRSKLTDMELSVRALNCLKAADIETLGDLVSYQKNDLLKFRNFGKKSLTELEDLVDNNNLKFGMNVEQYKLGNDL